MRVTNVHGPGDVRLDEAPEPTCGPADVLVAIKACGVCGTDVMFLQIGGMPMPGARCPLPLGHEPAGEVVEVGRDVVGVTKGMRVTFNPTFDEADATGSGGSQGALSDLVAVRDARLGVNLFEMRREVPFDVAALTEPLSVAMHAANRAEATPDSRVVVFGAGPVGVGIVGWLKLRGVRDIVSVDLSPVRLEQAAILGADAGVLGTEDVIGALRERHGTAHVLGAPVAATDVWIDAVGAPQVIDTIMRGARMHATALVVGVHKKPVQFDLVNFLTKELRFTSSMAYPTEFGDVAASINEHWRRFEPMISDRVPFADVAHALGLAGSTDVRGKVTVTF
jgi:threonine dehydrogenase-like Zn-dependent dehydrogenase